MKRTVWFLVVVVVLCMGSLLTCFAAYNYASPPGANVAWNFNGDRSYTANGECDFHYIRGHNGVLGIGAENTKTRSCTKARAYWYGECLAAIQSSSGQFFVTRSGTPTSSNTEMHSGWANAGNQNTPQFVQYEYCVFQVSGDYPINQSCYFYRSGWGLSKK